MFRGKQLISLILAGTMLVSVTSCFYIRKVDPKEIIDVAEAFARSVSSLDSKKILKNVENIDEDKADEFREKISLSDMETDERDLKMVIADTIDFAVDDDSVVIKKEKAYCSVEFTVVDYVNATGDLTGKAADFIDAINSCDKILNYTVSLDFVRVDNTWLITADCLDGLDDLYSFIDYEFDIGYFKAVNEDDFYRALEYIGIQRADTEIMGDTSFSFKDDDTEFEVVINIDATSSNENQYSYTKCVDEATAKKLFDYYYSDYKDVFYNTDFSGDSSHEVNDITAYILISGILYNQSANTYTPYHDAIFLRGDTVIVAIASDYDSSIEKEIDDFLDSLGYPHP